MENVCCHQFSMNALSALTVSSPRASRFFAHRAWQKSLATQLSKQRVDVRNHCGCYLTIFSWTLIVEGMLLQLCAEIGMFLDCLRHCDQPTMLTVKVLGLLPHHPQN